MLESLFAPEFAETCTESGCWQSLLPFLASTYAGFAILSVAALFFRPGRELRLTILSAASMLLIMAAVRLLVVPAEFYIEGAALGASATQVAFALLLVLSGSLPYPTPSPEKR